jgi:hypothetical protein
LETNRTEILVECPGSLKMIGVGNQLPTYGAALAPSTFWRIETILCDFRERLESGNEGSSNPPFFKANIASVAKPSYLIYPVVI